MILRDRCSTSFDLASLFRGVGNTLDRWKTTNRKTHWYKALNKVRFRNFTGLRNLDCATLWSDCATRIAQLPGLRNSACATTLARLRNSQDCATLLAQLPYTASNFKCTLSAHQGKKISKFPPPWNFKLTWSPATVRRYQNSNFPTPWNFKLTWSPDQGKKISTFPPPWNFSLTWSVHQGKKISNSIFPTPWNFKLTWSPDQSKKISKFPPPWNFSLTWSVH